MMQVLGFGEYFGRSYLVTEEINGQSLLQMLSTEHAAGRRQAFAEAMVVNLATQVLMALQAAHQVSLLHGHISMGCVFHSEQNVKLHFLALGHEAACRHYSAPEQIIGETQGFYTDVWAVGVLMYSLCEGRSPWVTHERQSLRDAILYQPTPELVSPSSRAFVDVVRRAMAKDPRSRFQTASDMLAALNAAQHSRGSDQGGPSPARQPPLPAHMMTPRARPQEQLPGQLAPQTPRTPHMPSAAGGDFTPRGGQYTPRVGGGEYTPRVGGGEHTPRVGGGEYTPRIGRGDYAPSVGSGGDYATPRSGRAADPRRANDSFNLAKDTSAFSLDPFQKLIDGIFTGGERRPAATPRSAAASTPRAGGFSLPPNTPRSAQMGAMRTPRGASQQPDSAATPRVAAAQRDGVGSSVGLIVTREIPRRVLQVLAVPRSARLPEAGKFLH
jgi:hypothetical protein